MQVVVWLITGLGAGWLARTALKGRARLGLLGDVILGALGGIFGGRLFAATGIVSNHAPIAEALVALCGAMLLLGLARVVLAGLARSTGFVPPRARSALAAGGELESEIRGLADWERRVVRRFLRRERVVRDVNAEFAQHLDLGQRVADRVAAFGGSWTFIGLFVLVMAVWMIVNSETIIRFDPYPFILLNLVLSCLAALQAPIIMMSQNREAEKDRYQARADYEVNMKAEMEIMAMSAGLDDLRQGQLARLLALHEETAARLGELQSIVASLKSGPQDGGGSQGRQ